jgi:hypothetical protein
MFHPEPVSLQPRRWPALIPLVLALVLFVFFSPQENDKTLVVFCSLLVLISGALFLALSKARIILDDTGLTHKNFLTSRSLPWQTVSKSFIKTRHHGQSRSYYWYFENRNGEQVKFSMRLYRTIAQAVTTKSRAADIEGRIYNMAEGVFPWYLF